MRCYTWTDGPGTRCPAVATHWIVAPDGRPVPGGWGCREHTFAAIAEYREKLDQAWTAFEIDDLGNPRQEVP